MLLTGTARKLTLAAHLTASVGWVGAAATYVALAAAADVSSDPQVVRASWIAMELIGWYVIVPLAVGSLVTGVAIALGTRWGLFRHYWVMVSLALTALATAVLVLHMPSVSSTADRVRASNDVALRDVGGDLPHPSIGLVLLLVILVLNIYKPRGMTRFGARKDRQRRTEVTPAGSRTSAP